MEDPPYTTNVYRLQKVLILRRALRDWTTHYINDATHSFLGNDQFCGFSASFSSYQSTKFSVCGLGDASERLMSALEGASRLLNRAFSRPGEVPAGFSCQLGFSSGYRRTLLPDAKRISWPAVESRIMSSIFVS